MSMKTLSRAVWTLVACLLACDKEEARSHEPVSAAAYLLEEAKVGSADNPVPGFLLGAGKSLLEIPSGSPEQAEGALLRVASPHAVQVQSKTHGWFSGYSLEGQKPFSGTLEEHNELIKESYLARGLPADQLGPVGGSVTMEAQHHVDDVTSANPPNTARLHHYTTRISRVVEGVPVIDSFVLASMDDAGIVRSETGYWPPISRATLNQAKALESQLATDDGRKAYLERMPSATQGETVRAVLRHSAVFHRGAREVVAAVEIESEDTGPMHFDANGKEVVFDTDVVRSSSATNDRSESEQEITYTTGSSCGLDGRWRLPGDDGRSIALDSGTWVYTSTSAELEGTYLLSGSELSVTDTGGSGLSPCDGGLVGTYEAAFDPSCDKLKLNLVADGCRGRRGALSQLRLERL